MAEDKARDRRASLDSGRERNEVIRSQGPDAARMDFINGLLGSKPGYPRARPYSSMASSGPTGQGYWSAVSLPPNWGLPSAL